ncbi:LysR family transcriptional regulator [Paludibacterium paludis]|uniref:Transcriptional regulator n=1 Tax=Paludibacterium paludis TaxID=1225769 RepID=A0A918P378_9NEIS|nr:LysR family transcriptional regulator [Paludibacterium paludis]GGY16427.1 transcriptional regulator [Paludibacterium paludis]
MFESLSELSVFVTVAEQGSFVGAGRVLGVSASAVGKRVSRLEAELGVRLMQRSTRSLALTEEGERVLQGSREILARAAALRGDVRQAREAPSGTLRLSLPPIGGVLIAPLVEFQRRYPHVALELDYSERNVDIIEEGFDAAIRVGDRSDSKLRGLVLPGFRRLLVAAPSYLAAHGEPETVDDLARHRLIHYRSPNSGKLETWPVGGELPQSLVCNSVHARLEFALQGLGIACLPDTSVRRELDNGSLTALLQSERGEPVPLQLLWPSSRGAAARLRALIAFLGDWSAHAQALCG